MKRIYLLIPILLLASACKIDMNINCVKGNGEEKTENRTVEPFTGVTASNGLDVEVVYGSTFALTITGDANLIEHVKTKRDADTNTLEISTDECIDTKVPMRIRVQLPAIEKLASNSGANLHTTGKFQGTKLVLKSSSGSQLNFSGDFDQLTAETSSGSSMELKGNSLKASLKSSSGSQLSASGLYCNEAVCQASSGSSIDVQAVQLFDGKASSGASISYKGSPKTVLQDTSSGGSIHGQ